MPSSVIANIIYNKTKEVLRIVYRSGMIYDYKAVPEKVYEEMKNSFSKGVFLNTQIKGKYEFEKVGDNG